jgi:hypothetical protein
MYSVSFNIYYTIANKFNVINISPYLYINEDLNKIMIEIRSLLYEVIKNNSELLEIPLENFNIALTIYTNNPVNIHIMEMNVSNIREIKNLIIEKNINDKYNNFISDFTKDID